MRPVFLSASEPSESRQSAFPGGNPDAIRAAVSAICERALQQGPLVFGGHPAITPVAHAIAKRIRDGRRQGQPGAPAPCLLMFQSRLYVSGESPSVVLTPAHAADGSLASAIGSRNLSLLRMRYEMLGYPAAEPVHDRLRPFRSEFGRRRDAALSGPGQEWPQERSQERRDGVTFRAAFFAGGMEGVVREFRIFRSFHPRTPAYPLASTGAAAKQLLEEAGIANATLKAALEDAGMPYVALMEQLLPADGDAAAPAYDWSAATWETGSGATRYSAADHVDPEELEREIPLP
jgi:hypothetical protein